MTTNQPIACSLTSGDAMKQLGEWADLRSALRHAAPVENGVRITFAPEVERTLRDLAAREATCCAFLDLVVTRHDDHVTLDVTSDQADARAVIDGLAQVMGASA